MDNYIIISCPVCGEQYLPSEIFFPDDLIGKPKEIFKDTSGKLDFYTGEDQNYDQYYVCDHCGSKLHIHASVKYDVNVIPDDFDEEYVSKFNRQSKFSLKEDQLFVEDN